MTVHATRDGYPTKQAAITEARRQQSANWTLYHVWMCVRCGGQWHVAPWSTPNGRNA